MLWTNMKYRYSLKTIQGINPGTLAWPNAINFYLKFNNFHV